MPNPITIFLIPTVLAEDTQRQVLPASVTETIRELDVFFVENIRTARRFISSLKLGKPIDRLVFHELSKDTPAADTRAQLQALTGNAGILSEAGCPGIADPGAVAVGLAHALQYRVVPLVGPSSILLALMASGMNGQSFVFHGYLPIDPAQRKKMLKEIERSAFQLQQTQIFMETPFRNNQLLQAILAVCNPQTRLCIAANLTGSNQLIATKTVGQWRHDIPDLHRQPTIFLMGGIN